MTIAVAHCTAVQVEVVAEEAAIINQAQTQMALEAKAILKVVVAGVALVEAVEVRPRSRVSLLARPVQSMQRARVLSILPTHTTVLVAAVQVAPVPLMTPNEAAWC